MKLIGAYSSPYSRRVAITLRHYGIAHDMKKMTPFGDAKALLRQINPVAKIPILALDDGEFLTESQVILDYLDTLVPEDTRLTPATGPEPTTRQEDGVPDNAPISPGPGRLHNARPQRDPLQSR